MSTIAIITDTDSSLPQAVAERYNIRQVPISILWGEEAFNSDYELNDVKMFEEVDRRGAMPTTSAPPPGLFAEAYKDAFEAGAEAVVCICVSGEVSATYNAALNAAQLMPEKKIEVVDSRSLSMGQGYMVLAAAEAAERGESIENIIAHAKDVGERTHYYAALATLKYLAMSGRVGNLAAGMANMLSIKPILTIREGKLDMLERIRTRKNAWARMIELVQEDVGDQSIERMSIIHVTAQDNAKAFETLLRENLPCPDEIMLSDLGAGLSVHSGPGLVGVSYVLSK